MPTFGADLKLVDFYVRLWRKADIGQTEDEGPLLPKADIRPPQRSSH